MNKQEQYLIDDDKWNDTRLDQFITKQLQSLSRSSIQKMIKNGLITVNDKQVKSGYKLCVGDNIQLIIEEPKEVDILPEDINLDIIYEDQDIIVINKPKDMVVHPAPGHYTGTVVNGLLYHCKNTLSGINGELRPGIVHRIDKNTTGVIVACKNDNAHRFIAEQLAEHSITRTYHAIVLNNLKQVSGTVEGDIGRHPIERKKMAMNVKNGKHAVTHYKVLDELNKKYNYISCNLETGRTHQIRVHMASIGHPILGDDIYGPQKNIFNLCGQTLHAKNLGFIHPTTKQYIEFEAPLPQYFVKLLELLQ